MKLIRIIKLNISSVLSFRNLVIMISIFIIHFITSNSFQAKTPIQTLILYFYGPNDLGISFLRWLLHQAPVIFMTGLYLDREIKHSLYMLLPRIENTSLWLFGITSSLFILIFVYYFIGFITTQCLIILFPSVHTINMDQLNLLITYNDNTLLLNIFFLIILSTFQGVLINILLTLIFKSSTISFTILLIIICLSVSLTNLTSELTKWLPLTQGMIIQNTKDFNLLFSYLYCIVLSTLLIFILKITVKRQIENLWSEQNI